MTNNQRAFLDMLAYSEIGPSLLAKSDNGYNVIVGGQLFNDYSDHPRRYVSIPKLRIRSSAAGRYQILARYYDAYKKTLKLPDFSPDSQDKIALKMIAEQLAVKPLEAGDFEEAMVLCANIWASLPGAGYGQHENELDTLKDVYLKAGGTLK
jgi:muramidase (phage lysozyme)